MKSHPSSENENRRLGSYATDDGVEFGVWAPFALSASVLIGEPFDWHETPLESDGKGNWFGLVADAQPGQTYKYKLVGPDGTVLERNDPRSRQLTASELGSSVIIDPHFDWEAVKQPKIPKEKQVIYELHVGTFNRPDAATSGTFYTAIEKLDYLKNLGITTIELMPITSIAMGSGWGYAPIYLFSVENSYGGRRGLLDFVKAAHERGMTVMLDVVYNHLFHSPDFPATDLWQFDGWHNGDEYGGIYFYNDERGKTPWGDRPDYGRPEVRQFILDNILLWLNEYKIDGLRIDSTIYMRNTRGPEGDASTEIPEAWSLLQEIGELAHKINPDSFIVAEDSSVNEAVTQPVEHDGMGFDAQWGLTFPHVVRAYLGMEQDQYGNTLRGEMQQSYNGEPFQKIIFSDSHDTAANGAVRLNEAAPGNAGGLYSRQYALVANAVTLTAPGVPLLLQGSEFLQEGAFNDWQMLDWERTEQFAGIVLAHKHIIDLRLNRHENSAGLSGKHLAYFHQNDDCRVIGYHRWHEGGVNDDIIVIANFSDQQFKEYELTLPVAGTWTVRFNSSWHGYNKDFADTKLTHVETDKNGSVTIPLSDYNILILGRD